MNPRCAWREAGACEFPLTPPTFQFDWDRIGKALSRSTRLIIINSPQNPSCTVAGAGDLDALAALVRDRPISILADEVYEHVLYDGRKHASVLAHPELRDRSFAVFFFRQDAARNGMAHWLLRCAAGDDARVAQSASIQYLQHRLAAPARDCSLPRAVSRCLDGARRILRGQAGFIGRPAPRLGIRARWPAAGTYFQLVDYGALSKARRRGISRIG